MQHIIVISDGTGGTAKRLLDAALVQFPEHEAHISVRPEVRTPEQIQIVMSEAEAKGSFIVHTMASEEMRAEVLRLGKLHNIETIDMMGSLLARLSSQFDISPTSKPGLFTRLNSDYFRRIKAVEFAIKHDDGKRVNDLEDAEFVLLGVSRTFKTPLSIYMSFMGWHTANVPIILDITPPEILEKIKSKRVYCLTTRPRRLSVLRRTRQDYLGGSTGDYATVPHAARELEYAEAFYNKHPGWTLIDVTNKPIEEIASEILSVARKRNAP